MGQVVGGRVTRQESWARGARCLSWATCLGGFRGERRTTHAPNRNNAIHVTRGNIVLLQPCHPLFLSPFSPFSVSSAVTSSESLPRSITASHNRGGEGHEETWKICCHIPRMHRSTNVSRNLKEVERRKRLAITRSIPHEFGAVWTGVNFSVYSEKFNFISPSKIHLMERKIEFARGEKELRIEGGAECHPPVKLSSSSLRISDLAAAAQSHWTWGVHPYPFPAKYISITEEKKAGLWNLGRRFDRQRSCPP